MTGIDSRLQIRLLHRSATLDVIRGLAILQVLVWHFYAETLGESSLTWRMLLGLTWSGVDLFFVLSGYLIGGIVIDQVSSANFYSVFYARRAIRILPLYILIVVIYELNVRAVDPLWGFKFFGYILFVQNFWWAAQGTWGPDWTGVTWSLAVEEQFYLVLPAVIRLCPPRRLKPLLVGLIIAAPFARWFVASLFGNHYAAYLLMPCRMDALFIGVIAAWTMRQPALIRRLTCFPWTQAISLLILWSGFGFLLVMQYDSLSIEMQSIGYSWIAMTYGATLLWVVARPHYDRVTAKFLFPLSYAGLGAYSIYLLHRPLRSVISPLFDSKLLTSLVATILVFGLAAFSWHFFEAPLMAFGRKRFRYNARPAALAKPAPLDTDPSGPPNSRPTEERPQ